MDPRAQARSLRSAGLTVKDVAAAVRAPAGTVYGWVRDIPGPPRSAWRAPVRRTKGALHDRRLAEIAACDAWAADRVSTLSDDAFFAAGIALYVGEGSKRDGEIGFTNTDPAVVGFFVWWLRTYFEVDESRLRARLYLHEGLDLAAAVRSWSERTGIPPAQFGKSYRAVPREGIRRSKHQAGCLTVRYGCSKTHREVMGLARALISSTPFDPA